MENPKYNLNSYFRNSILQYISNPFLSSWYCLLLCVSFLYMKSFQSANGKYIQQQLWQVFPIAVLTSLLNKIMFVRTPRESFAHFWKTYNLSYLGKSNRNSVYRLRSNVASPPTKQFSANRLTNHNSIWHFMLIVMWPWLHHDFLI